MTRSILAGMGKRPDKQQPPSLEGMAIESFDDWMTSYSEADERSLSALDTVSSMLEKADVDAKRRKIIWEDGQRLSITQSAERIHADHPDLPLDLIESKVISWLQMEFAPETYSQDQLDELDRLTEKWVDDYERKTVKRQQPRTPDS
jgi:hypothetical protein